MSEHRSLFGTLAVTLIGIGLAGYVSLRVASAVANHAVRLGPTENLCLVVFDAGIVIFAAVSGSLIHQWVIKSKISKFMSTGILLMADTRRARSGDKELSEALWDRYVEWVTNILEWLGKHDVGAAIYFGNDAGQLMMESLVGDSIATRVDMRMGRLAEIAAKRL